VHPHIGDALEPELALWSIRILQERPAVDEIAPQVADGPLEATVSVNQNATMSAGATTASASVVTVSYPFSFMVLNPIARLVVSGSALGNAPLMIGASAEMRNEAK
jgi:hypothetical protein